MFALQISMDTDFVTMRNLDQVPKRYLSYVPDGIQLTCIAGGYTSPNSKTSRTEFREVDEYKRNAYWDSDRYKSLCGRLSVTKLPIIKKSVMFSQIKLRTHGAPLMMFLRESTVYLVCNTAKFKKRQIIDNEYTLGDIISFNYTVNNGNVSVYYQRNSQVPVILYYSVDFKDAYFKFGNYMQSPSPPEPSNSTSIVKIYNAYLHN